ncbi:YncE family protein [Mycolicibacterium goodii]|uniref:Lipoprotein n=1 Tax=Mycolicibacterium goodii TaxID=134601 RepID=A0A0K0X8I2_MYCGD|nr:lipoprotein [Mycolicibacterium goodii]
MLRLITAGQPLFAGIVSLTLVLTAGCSSNVVDAPPPTIEPARAAVSPPATQPPDGQVRPLGAPGQAAVFDPATRRLAVLSTDAEGQSAVALLGEGSQAPVTVPLGATATALSDDGKGGLLLATRGGYFRIDLTATPPRPTRVDVDGRADTDFTAIALREDGNVVLGSADGAVYTLTGESAVGAELKIFARVDSLVTQGNTAIVLDRGQTSVTTVDPSGTKAAHALRAGEGATTIATDPRGRVLVADTRGDGLLVYSVDPLILRQRSPVRGAPYGLAGSANLVWVSETATNTVIGYDLSTGIPVEKVRYRTVQQPNSLAYDETSGTLYVVSATGAGVQVIPNATVKP